MPEDKLPIPQFAAKIKAKYPDYKDINDTVLVQRILAKYPQYADKVDMSGIEEPVKKKVSSVGSLVGGGVTPSGTTSGIKEAPIGDILKFASGQALPLDKIDRRLSDKELEDEALRRFSAPSDLKQDDLDNNDPIGNLMQKVKFDSDSYMKSFDKSKITPIHQINELAIKDKQVQLLKELYVKNGEQAKSIVSDLYSKNGGVFNNLSNAPFNTPKQNIDQLPLEEIQAKLPNTFTAKVAFDKYAQKRKIDDAWAKTNNIYDAAAAYYGENLNELSEARRGRLIDNFINDPIVKEKAANDGKFNNAVAGAMMEQYNNNPSFVIQKVATKISQKLEDEKLTGGWFDWLYSNPGVETVQKAVDMLKDKGEWSGEDELAYQRDILPLVKAGKSDKVIRTTDLLHNIGYGVYEGFEGVDASARDIMNKTVGGGLLTGSSWMQDLGLMESNKDRTKRLEQKEYSRTGVEPKGLLRNITAGGGHFLGFTAPMILGGAANLPEAATMIMMFEGKNADKARAEFKGNVGLQNSYTLLSTTIDAALGPFLHTNKAAEGIKTLFKKDAAELIHKLGSKEISEAEAKQQLLTRFTNYIGKTAKSNISTANVLTAYSTFHNGLDALFGKRNFSLESELSEAVRNYGTNFLSGTLLSGVSALKGRNLSYANEINRLAENPERTRELIKGDPEKLKNFDYLLKVREQLANRTISEEQRNQYAFKALQKKVLEEKIKNAADKTLAKEEENKIKEIEIEQKTILDPEMGNQKIVQEFYDNELLPKGVSEMLEVEGKFSPSKVGEVLKFIAQQANGLTEDWKKDPNGFKSSMPDIPDQLVEMANERWAKEIEAAQPKEEVSIEQPQRKIETHIDKSSWESNIRALSNAETGLGATVKNILEKQRPLKEAFLKRIGLSLEDYTNLDEVGKQKIESQWIKSKEFEELQKQSEGNKVPEEIPKKPITPKIAKEKRETAQSRARKVYRDIGEIDEPTDAIGMALSYLAGGGKINEEDINDISGRVKRATLNTGAKEKRTNEVKGRDYASKTAPTIDEIAHSIWDELPEEVQGMVSEADIKNELNNAVLGHNTRLSAATEFRDRYVLNDVRANLTEQEAKELDDIAVSKRKAIIGELPEHQTKELLDLLQNYEDQYGNIDWDRLEKDTNGFSPEILSLSSETQNALNEIIQKNISETGSQPDNIVDKNGIRQEKNEGEAESVKPATEIPKASKELADKVRNLKINLSKLSGGGLQSNPLGLPVAVWNGAMDIVASTIEAGGEVVDAVKRGINYIQKNHRGQWDKKGFNDQVMKELGVRGITVNGEDLLVKTDPKSEREFAQTVNGWYSDLEQSVLDVKGDNTSGENWKKVLGNSDEAKWTGLNEWLSKQKGNVSKKDIQQYLKDNRIEIVEVIKDSKQNVSDKSKWKRTAFGDGVWTMVTNDNTILEINASGGEGVVKVYADNWLIGEEEYDSDPFEEGINIIESELDYSENPTKFSQYQLEGQKENYKEVLVTLPNEFKESNLNQEQKDARRYDEIDKKLREINISLIDTNNDKLKNEGKILLEEQNILKEKYNGRPEYGILPQKDIFKSSHFDEPNILVHLRMNTRTDADGKKVLFLEEVQSDWNKTGQQKGFKNEENINELQKQLEDAKNEYNKLDFVNLKLSEIWETPEAKKVELLNEKINNIKSGVPKAPFVIETPSYVKLGLKVALKEAVKQGADRIAWTTGEQQNERYDLSKQVDEITYFYSPSKEIYQISLHKNGNVEGNKDLTESELEAYVGKEIAQKMINGEGKEYSTGLKSLSGVDLKVGGKGMKGFYGEPAENKLGIVGEVAKSLFKQEPKTTKIPTDNGYDAERRKVDWDKVKVNVTQVKGGARDGLYFVTLEGGGLFETLKDKYFEIAKEAKQFGEQHIKEVQDQSKFLSTQHSIDITPELKQEVEGGLPLFKDIKGRGKEIADALRKGKIKIDGLQSNVFGIPVAVWNAAVETIATAIEKGSDLASAIKEAIDKHKLDKLKTFDRNKFIAGLEKATGEKLVEDGGKEPPKAPPTEPTEKEISGLNDKAVLNRLVNSSNISSEVRKQLLEAGLKYEPVGHQESQAFAKSIVDELGINESVRLAEANKFKGGTNTAIFAEAMNRLFDQEMKAKTPEEAIEIAKQSAEIGIRMDEFEREKGRDISQVAYFYKKSPLGMQIMENVKRKQEFDSWSKPKEKSWKEFFDEMMKEPEFETIVKEQVKESLKQERAAARESRKKKVDDFFDKAKDQFKGGAAYSTIIPPKVITTALEGMRKAYHAGESVVKVVQDAIDYISDQLGGVTWDKEKFRKEWEGKLADKPSGKRPLTDEELKTKILDKFRKKLKGLSDKEKEEVVRKAFKQIVDAGGLDYEDFKKIIADVTGRGDMTVEQSKQLKELVDKTNAVEAAAKKAQEERTDKALEAYYAAQLEAGKASRELGDLLYNKPDIVKRLTSIMQLSTLGVASLVRNPVYNVFNQLLVRFPVGLTNDLIDRGLAAAANMFGKNYNREYNILETQADFWSKLGFGSKEAVKQLFTGLNRMDYTQKEVYGQQIRPMRAIKDLYAAATGKKKLTSRQVTDKALQATVGVPAEAVARVLNLGDKPQRFAAEGGQASAFAKMLGLKDIDKKIFMNFPKEEAYRVYKSQGLSDAEASKKAEYIYDSIIKEGERSTFQQNNYLNDILNRAFSVLGGEKSGWANLAKTLTISPYIKIPSNAFWSGYNLLNPEIAVLQAMIYGGASKAMKAKGRADNAPEMAMREARYWMGHAVAGIALRAVILGLVSKGVFTPSSQKDDSKREREGAKFFTNTGTVDLGKLNALLNGKDPDEVKNGLKVSNNWFAQFGYIGDAIARKYQDMTPEQKEKQEEFWNTVIGGMEVEGLADLQNGVFANTSAVLNALGSPAGGQQYLLGLVGMATNIIHPATLAQLSRSEMPYYTTTGSGDFMKKLENSMLQRSSLLRNLTGKYPPSKIDIWGQTMQRSGTTMQKYFGISRDNPDAFARPLFDDYQATGNINFLPPAVYPKIGKEKLNDEQYSRLQTYIGGARKALVAPYINDNAVFEVIGKRYSEIKDEDTKLDILNYLYELGRKNGMTKFMSDYPQFKKKEPDWEQKMDDKLLDIWKKLQKYKNQ